MYSNHSIETSSTILSHSAIYYFNLLVLTFEPVDEILWCDHSNETSSAVRSHSTIYYLNLLVLTIEPVDEILWCDHSNEPSSAFIWHGPLLACLGLNDSTGRLH